MILQSAARKIWFLSLALALSLGAMSASFLLVKRHMVLPVTGPIVDQETLHAARSYREIGNLLTGLLNDLEKQAPPEVPAPTPAASAWMTRTLLPELVAVRTRLGEDLLLGGRLYRDLAGALDRAIIMARTPTDAALRRAAVAQLRNALREIEAHIATLRIEHQLHEPRRRAAGE